MGGGERTSPSPGPPAPRRLSFPQSRYVDPMFLECHLSKTINLKKIGHFSFSCSYKKHAHRPKAMEWSTYIILGSKREHRARDWVLGTRSACAVRTGVMSRRQEVGWTWNSKIWFRKCWVGSKNFLIYNHDRRGTRFQFRRRQSKIMSLYVRVLVCHFWELEVVEFCNKNSLDFYRRCIVTIVNHQELAKSTWRNANSVWIVLQNGQKPSK